MNYSKYVPSHSAYSATSAILSETFLDCRIVWKKPVIAYGRKNVFMGSMVIKYKIHSFGYLGYKCKVREACLAISEVQTLLFGLEKAKILAIRNEPLQFSLASLHARCRFEVRSLAYACAEKISQL